MKHFVTVRIPFRARTPARARELCRKALTSGGFVHFEIDDPGDAVNEQKCAEKAWDECPECGAPPGECDPRCGQFQDDVDQELRDF